MITGKYSRRRFLGRLASLGALGIVTALRPALSYAVDRAEGLRRIVGRVIHRTHENYESWRSSMTWFIYKPKRYPEYIVSAQSEADVIEAVNYARDKGLKIAVRGTGHNITGSALRNQALTLDVAALNKIDVDVESATAWIQPGVRSEEFMNHINALGFMFPAAHTGVVGLGGFLLGGGLGWNVSKLDIACRSVISAEIVTADGNKVRATPTQNADLLWAVRGSGQAFFGVVTGFQVKLYAQPKAMIKSTYILPEAEMTTLTDELMRLDKLKDDNVEVLAVIKHAADIKGMKSKGLACIVSLFAFADSEAQAQAMLKPYATSNLAARAALKKEHRRSTFTDIYAGQAVTDGTSMFRTTLDSMWTNDPVETFHSIAERLRHSPSPRSFVISVWGFRPAHRDDTAVPYFGDHYFSYYMIADSDEHVEPNFGWMKETIKVLRPLVRGRYINEVEGRRHPEHFRDCFTDQGWQKLAEMRKKYDPKGVFHKLLGHD